MLCALALFAGGVAAGWRLRIRYTDKTADAVRIELSEKEKRRQREEAQAFSHLTNYSPELAYGIVKAADIYETDDTDDEG